MTAVAKRAFELVSGPNALAAAWPSGADLSRVRARLALTVRQSLPRGRTLPPEVWARRHRAMLWLLALHAIGLAIYADLHGYPLVHSLGHAAPLAALAVLAAHRSLGMRVRSGLASVGLLTASAILVHTSGGLIETHFHFFVMIAVIALYEDWIPYLLAGAYVVVHHGLMGAFDPSGVYNHPDAVAHPWKWAAIHGVFVIGAGAAGVIAWRLNEDVRRSLHRKNDEIGLLGAVAAAANEASTIDDALGTCVDLVCSQTGWPVGHAFVRAGDELVPAGVWHIDHPNQFDRFRKVTESITFRSGHGLPGRVLASGTPAWITDTAADDNFPRADVASECGIASAFAFPVRIGTEVAAVLEFFSEQALDPDEEVLEVMDRIGTQLGRVFERRRAEDEQSRFFSLASDLVAIADSTGRLRHFNVAWEHTLGYSPEELRSKPFLEFVHPDDRERTAEEFLRILNGHSTTGFENRYLCADGSTRWILWNAVRALDGDSVYATGHNITDRKRVEQDRERLLAQERQQVERLRELDRLKDDFVASVSHELRTPLTSIRGFLDLLHDGEAGPLSKDQEQVLAIVDRNADRLLRLVGDLLEGAQLEGSQLVLKRKRVALAALAGDAVERARAVADTRGLELVSEASAAPVVLADPSRLSQVVDNLLSNALKFTPAGGTVRVGVAEQASHAVLTVSDTGIGVAKDEQARLFERFFRASAAGEHAFQGTGLGLWITKTIVEAHEGTIAVASDAGAGTTFVVELPLEQAGESAHAGPTLIEVA
jgi:PAS domain S-box-containing protein